VVAATVLLLAGCGGGAPEEPQQPTRHKPDTSNIKIDGDPNTPVNKLAIEAIADLQDFWGTQFPKLYDNDYEPIKGGLYASTPESENGPECAKSFADVSGNAFYCKLDDSVAWDADGLLPQLQDKFGDFVIPVVLAHEWGHAIQQRSGFFDENKITVSSELQADCFAGAWAKHAQEDKVFDVSTSDLDNALAGVLSLKDRPGTTSDNSPDAHGSGFDRVSAFQDGYDNSVEKCKGYKDGEPQVLELPFTNEEDLARGGDAPYGTVITSVPYDLEDYYAHAFPQLSGGKAWTPLAPDQPFDEKDPPSCGGTPVTSAVLFYCVDDDFVGWDTGKMQRLYLQGGDWAVATLLATQWGLAAQHRLGDDLSDVKTTTARADCLAGAYSASVVLHDRADTSTVSISPGDLDEGIKALLVFAGDKDSQGAGFDRTRAYREGVLKGPNACVKYQA
jgi:predicted metalloprotease